MSVAMITCPALDAAILRFSSASGRVEAALAEGNAAISATMQAKLDELYGPRLARRWRVTSAINGGHGAAEVSVASSDPRVLGYEFGTRPHLIAARNASVLSFPWRGAQAFYAHVQHPGTQPHNRRDQVEAALAASAQSEWNAALQAALAE